MELKKKRRVGEIALGFFMLTHAERIVLILVVVALFAVRATWLHSSWTIIANALPDVEEDAASKARTLAVVLGVKGSFIACPLLIVPAAALIAALTRLQLVSAQLRSVIDCARLGPDERNKCKGTIHRARETDNTCMMRIFHLTWHRSDSSAGRWQDKHSLFVSHP